MKAASFLLLLFALPAFADQPAQSTVSFALEAIRDRALIPYKVETIAVAGLRGLSTLDPALDVGLAHHRLQLRYRGHAVGGFGAPPEEDVAGWTLLIEQAAREAARHSTAIAKADADQLTEAVVDGFLTRLDIFSHYAGPAEARERRASRSGFGGIGIRYDIEHDFITVTEVIPDSPAAAAKLKIGDRIAAIDDAPLAGLEQNDIVVKLRGPIASPIKLALRRDGSAPTITLHRALIVTPTVTSRSEDGIGVITLSGFNENSAASVRDAVRKLKAVTDFKGLVLDLRGNLGGLLDQGVTIADLFIEHGRILATAGRHPAAAQSQDAHPGDPGESVPLVVLIDGHTASAAEILASDLQDSGRAVLVGTNSFGKGAIQTVLELPNHGEMTLTWSRFFTPSGYALHGLGLLPNICTAAETKPPSGDAKLAGGRAAATPMFQAWHNVAPDDMADRSRLRSHCPAGHEFRQEP